ncbi:hypothetical protein [Treponema denticola]|jgi:hypothetical protein|uniref:N-acetyltransferase domain-containing protein n=1 Tax=Treponema denticola H1-T TaxID=999431 RepID=M2C4B9_TREDN|nr:hypothetical protein [Treponema denticola]EMB28477.1 hypothetical protein HMPREF9727_01736 [Treponema denticola MYR-T]EMB29219.1 hypothetical protein HMPREF9725_02089 [Treponema denticola H1-T]EMB39531.1 hypothetical protein HMPREF9722_01890 [Treponema denticola ATCC 33520]UTC85331.1 hypothetical protein E4N91_06700 [Treponema denticola]
MSKIDVSKCLSDFKLAILNAKTDVSSFTSEYGMYTDFINPSSSSGSSLALEYDKYGVAKTYLIYKKDDIEKKSVCAYFSIGPDMIGFSKENRPDNVPLHIDTAGAIKIHYLASSLDFAEKYSHIVKFIILLVKNLIAKILNKNLNIRYITLDADDQSGNKDIVEIYKSVGFYVAGKSFELDYMIYDIYS